MAGIIEVAGLTGRIWYGILRNASAQVWNGSTFETYNAVNYSTYDVAVTEQGSSGYYSAIFPAGISSAGKYSFTVHEQLGGSPAEGDPVVAQGYVYWDGASEEQGLTAIGLNKLINTSAGGTPPTIGSFLDQIMNTNSGQTFSQATDSLESLRDSGTGPTVGQIADAVWDEVLDAGHVVADSGAERLKAIDNKLPTGNISDFDEATNNVNLNASQTGVTIGAVNSLGSTAQSQVNAQMVDALFVDVISELSAAAPSATPTIANALMFMYMALRNKRSASTTEDKVHNNAGSVIAKATISDSGTVTTKDQYVAGP